MVTSNTVHINVSDRVGSYTFSGEQFNEFSRIFLDPTLIYMNLPPTNQNVCVESYVLVINTFTCRNATQCKGSLKRRANQALVVRKVDNTIHWINHYPADGVVCFVSTYLLDSDLSGE